MKPFPLLALLRLAPIAEANEPVEVPAALVDL